MALPIAWYNTGTITVANNSPMITGSTTPVATAWSSNVVAGEGLLINGVVYEIKEVVSNTSIELAKVYAGSTSSGLLYSIIPTQGYVRNLALQAGTLINEYQTVFETSAAGKFSDSDAGIAGIGFIDNPGLGLKRTGNNTMDVIANGVRQASISTGGVNLKDVGLTLEQDTTSAKKARFLIPNAAPSATTDFTLPAVAGTLVTLAGTETLINKTLTNPVINGTITTTGLTLPAFAMGGAISNASNYAANFGTGALTAGAGTFTELMAKKDGSDSIGLGPLLDLRNSNNSHAWTQQLGLNNTLDIWNFNGSWAKKATFSSTGFAVTGALTAGTGTFSSQSGLVVGATNKWYSYDTGTTTYLTDTAGGDGNGIAATSGTGVKIRVGGNNITTVSSTGLAVTGALSCTGNTTLGDAAGDTLNVANGALKLDASGQLGIGVASVTGTPANGFTVIDTSGPTYTNIGHSSGTGTGAGYSRFLYAGTIIGSITQSGTTAVAYNTTSDHRLKENVRPANAARFMDIEFVDFEWIDGRHDCGVIADQLQSVYPDLVFGEKDATEVRTVEITPAVPAVTEERLVTPAISAVVGIESFPAIEAAPAEYTTVTTDEMVLIDGVETVISRSKLVETKPAVEARLAIEAVIAVDAVEATYETVEITPAISAVTEEQTFPVYQQVNYTGLIGRMGTRVQQLQRTVDAQAAMLVALEARLAALEAV
jgi:hypothetical protein